MKNSILISLLMNIILACEKTEVEFPKSPTINSGYDKNYYHEGFIKSKNTNTPLEGVTVIAYKCDGSTSQISGGDGWYSFSFEYCWGNSVEYSRVTTNAQGYFNFPPDSFFMGMSFQKTGYWNMGWISDSYYMALTRQIELHILDTITLPYNNRRFSYSVRDSVTAHEFLRGETELNGNYIFEGECNGNAVNSIYFSGLDTTATIYVFCPAGQKTIINFVR